MIVPYAGACSSNIKPNKPGLSGGSVLLIIIFVLLGSYIIVGMGYNILIAHKTGVEIIPHHKFWLSLFLYSLVILLSIFNLYFKVNRYLFFSIFKGRFYFCLAIYNMSDKKRETTQIRFNLKKKEYVFCSNLIYLAPKRLTVQNLNPYFS
jgi:hypothetical protein